MAKKLLTTSVALALTVPLTGPVFYAGAQSMPGKAPGQTAQKSDPFANPQAQDNEWHFVVSAEDLIGSPVYDANEERAGDIEYLLIGMDGKVRYAVLSGAGFLDIGDELRAVPWSAFDTPVSRTAARLDVGKDELKNSYKISREKLADLTKPSIITTVTNYWAPLTQEGADSESKNGSENRGTGNDSKQNFSETKSGRTDGSQANAETSRKRMSQTDSGDRSTVEPNSTQAPSESQNTQQAQQDEGVPHILIGRGITTVVEPGAKFAKQWLGSEVKSSDGKDIGQLDHLMIETSMGRVAYALISKGGFLGFDEKWIPVPFGVLQWSEKSDSVMLQAKTSDLKNMKAFGKTERPRSVRESDLAKLYEQYGVDPFWSESEQSRDATMDRQTPSGARAEQKS